MIDHFIVLRYSTYRTGITISTQIDTYNKAKEYVFNAFKEEYNLNLDNDIKKEKECKKRNCKECRLYPTCLRDSFDEYFDDVSNSITFKNMAKNPAPETIVYQIVKVSFGVTCDY